MKLKWYEGKGKIWKHKANDTSFLELLVPHSIHTRTEKRGIERKKERKHNKDGNKIRIRKQES